MTAKDLAKLLDGREYRSEITDLELIAATQSGLVVVFGVSDDLVRFKGAIADELGAYERGKVLITKDKVFDSELIESAKSDIDNTVVDMFQIKPHKSIEVVWNNHSGPCWFYKTDIPHETFMIHEDGELYCEGIVFSVNDLPE